jgi:hypothetical protein
MRMRGGLLLVLLLSAWTLFAQSDRGTITGTVSDPTGAVIPGANIVVTNTETAARYETISTETGNYTLTQLPSGLYQVTVELPGFKKYVRQGLTVQAAQIVRIDVGLEVGNATESVTVEADAPLLKTESGELSHVITTRRIDELPILQTGAAAGSGGIRNPFTVVALIPGSALIQGGTGPTIRINGGTNNSYMVMVDGMDATNSLGQGASQQNQPGVDSIQEFAIQTSNYSAEFGQTGNAIMNITFKSGTNQFHGAVYEYFVNEFMNAGQPFTNDPGKGGLIRTRQRRNDYGFTLSGPVVIPSVYDGHNKTFFNWAWEQYRIGQNVLPNALSVPTEAFRRGDFSAILGRTAIGTDPLGRPIFANQIYDPATRRAAPNGQIIADPFPNNVIPSERFDPVAKKVQALIPLPTDPNLISNNYQQAYRSERTTTLPSLKIDQVLGTRDKLSFLWYRTGTFCWYCAGAAGLPQPIDTTIGTDIHAHTERLNWDHTVSPRVLFHVGVGYSQNWLGRPALLDDYDATGQLGLTGPFTRPATFPVFTGLTSPAQSAFGGMGNMGSTASKVDDVFQQYTTIASLTWTKNSHTYKFGYEGRFQGDYNLNAGALNGQYGFSNVQTALPYVVAANSAGQVGNTSIGFPYASFLLGLVNTANAKPPSSGRVGKHQLGFYGQDSWKLTRKLTLDIGLRYDYSTYLKEQYGRTPNLDPTAPNPSAGGLPGAVQYEATCNCNFAKNYPWGFGPRLGVAYRFMDKTVLRAGFGIVYTGTPQYNLSGGAAAASNPIGPNSESGREIMTLATGLPLTRAQIAWPNFNPGYYPINPTVNPIGGGPPYVVDKNAGRPGRQYQWSVGLQREIIPNLLVEASYVGNRAIWLTYTGLVNYNYLSRERLASFGLSLANATDRTILSSPINSVNAGRFQNRLPYPGFPPTATVAQSLRPFPQFNSQLAPLWSPLGNTWYDSLQIKVTKRFSHGLDFTYAFTWAKELDTISRTTIDVQDRASAKGISSNSRPFISGLGFNYTVPRWGSNKALSIALRDWTIGGFLQYTSGLPIAPPPATANPLMQNITFQTTVQNRVPGEPLFTQDLNCHCFDPHTTFVLNPKAWTNPDPGTFGTGTYYNDFRQQRRPTENLAVGRGFRMTEKTKLNLRIEFTNVLNRTFVNNPTATNPGGPQTRVNNNDPNSPTTGGYGYIDTSSVNLAPRQGQIVARFEF